jgi:RNA polymerase sigma-70 factor (ECF subfamily)
MAQTDTNRLRYEQWVRSYAPQLYRYAFRLTGSSQIAEDLVQETFMEAWRFIFRQKDDRQSRAWLFQILRHRHAHFLRDTRRHRQSVRLADDSDAHPAHASEPLLNRLAEQDALQAALNSLSPMIRETFLMVFSQGCTCRETAEALRIPIGTVLSRLDSARRTLRASLADPSRPRQAAPMTSAPDGRSI